MDIFAEDINADGNDADIGLKEGVAQKSDTGIENL